jgi:hypothetical protein
MSTLRKPWFIFFVINSLEGVAALAALIAIPNEGGGFSASRVAMLGMVVVVAGCHGALAYKTWRREDFIGSWFDPRTKPRLLLTAVWVGFLLAAAMVGVLFILRYYDPVGMMPYYLRVRPLAIYLALTGIQTGLWGLYVLFGFRTGVFSGIPTPMKGATIVAASLYVIWGLVCLTGLGITPDPIFWRWPGSPLQFWQIGLALLGGTVAYAIYLQFPRIRERISKVGGLIPFLVWGCAVLLWTSVPVDVLRNSQFAPMDPPTYQPFPYSDAANYDTMAQSLLLGSGLMGDVPHRPLYILFLSALHALAGDDYRAIIFLQTLVLALFPVFLYLIGEALHSPLAGSVAALLAIFRELDNLWISPDIEVSNSKELLSDLPTALGVAVLIYVCIRWLRSDDKRYLWSVVLGGSLGLLVLLRTQAILILPFLLILALLADRSHWRNWLGRLFVVLVVLAATLAPWVYRNWRLTGRLIFDEPYSQTEMVARRYAFSQDFDIHQLPSENQWAYADRLNAHIVSFALDHPAYVAQFIANHFMANEIYTLLVLPIDSHFAGGWAENDLYWLAWQKYLSPGNLSLMAVYLLVISLGLAAAWRRLHWVGLAPIFINIAYSLSNAVARNSGWRFILPVDWVGYFYFAMGSVEIIFFVAALFGAGFPATTRPTAGGHFQSWQIVLAGLAFVAGGAALPLLERAIPPHFKDLPKEDLIGQIADFNPNDVQVMKILADQPEGMIVQGRLFYPRYFRAGDGIVSANPWPAFAGRGFNRLGFVLISDHMIDAVLPIDKSPVGFPDNVDVIAAGCFKGDYLDVRLLVLPDRRLVYKSAQPLDSCTSP